MFPEATRNETRPSGDRQSDYHARALAELRRRANQQECRANQRWAKLDAQAVALQHRIAAADSEGNARAADLARRALGKVVAAMKTLLGGPGAIAAAKSGRSAEQEPPDPTQPHPNGDPWTRG